MPLEIERKFLVSSFKPDCEWPVRFTESTICQAYLKEPGERTRRRIYVDETPVRNVYTHTKKKPVSPGVFEEDEREISLTEWIELQAQRDYKYMDILKIRKVFDWEGRTFELDVFQRPGNLIVLEVELPDIDAPVELPPFIVIDREVTGDPEWSNQAIAHRKRWC